MQHAFSKNITQIYPISAKKRQIHEKFEAFTTELMNQIEAFHILYQKIFY